MGKPALAAQGARLGEQSDPSWGILRNNHTCKLESWGDHLATSGVPCERSICEGFLGLTWHIGGLFSILSPSTGRFPCSSNTEPSFGHFHTQSITETHLMNRVLPLPPCQLPSQAFSPQAHPHCCLDSSATLKACISHVFVLHPPVSLGQSQAWSSDP